MAIPDDLLPAPKLGGPKLLSDEEFDAWQEERYWSPKRLPPQPAPTLEEWVGSQALSSEAGLIIHARRDVLFTPEEAFNRILTQDKIFNGFLQDVIELRHQGTSCAEDDDLPATAYSIANAIYVSLLPRMALGSNWSRPHVTTDGYGGIRMSWIKGDREVRAVIPPDANPGTRRRYIYWDSGEKYGSVPNFTPSSLRAWLAWQSEEMGVWRKQIILSKR